VNRPEASEAIADWPLLLGDDLTGSAESASMLVGAATLPPILKLVSSETATDRLEVTDLDTRDTSPREAVERTDQALGKQPTRAVVLKIDSLLRGNIAAYAAALRRDRHPIVLAPTLPAQQRSVIDGIPMLDGIPLSRSTAVDAWTSTGQQPPTPETVADVLGGLAYHQLNLTDLHSTDVAFRIERAAAEGQVVIADAITDADLDRLVAATLAIPRIRYLGSAALVAAIRRSFTAGRDGHPDWAAYRRDALPTKTLPPGVLVVVGTAESVGRRQAATLADHGAAVLEARPDWFDDTRNSPVSDIAALLATRPVVIQSGRLPMIDGRQLTARLADLVRRIAADPAIPLALIGGRTARAVLDALSVPQLTVHGSVHYGAVALRANDGRPVVTRPGSFGAEDSLLKTVRYLGSVA
jgi:4-hydroxythreonine-4-phosphate dehydrogenase